MADEPLLGIKILVVDDDPNVVELVRLYLEQDGHEVLTASDGATGLEMAKEQAPNLIVLDLMPPGWMAWKCAALSVKIHLFQ